MGETFHNLEKSGLFGLAGWAHSTMKTGEDNKAAKAAATANAAADKATAEQKALQDQQKEKSNRAAMRLSASSSGFSGGSNTARSFLTTF